MNPDDLVGMHMNIRLVNRDALVIHTDDTSPHPMVGRVITIGLSKACVAWGNERFESLPQVDDEYIHNLKVIGRYIDRGREIMYEEDVTDGEAFPNLRKRGQTVVRGRRLTSDEASGMLNDLGAGLQAMFASVSNPRWPAQPPVGSILRWERTFKSSAGAAEQPVYTYVALRVDDRWFVTGRANDIVNWEQLMKKIGDSPCHIVTKYREIPRPAADPREGMDPDAWFNNVYGGGVQDHDETEADAKAKKK
jgi:hypothetical protein